jgi:histidine triad (HIT) family protein
MPARTEPTPHEAPSAAPPVAGCVFCDRMIDPTELEARRVYEDETFHVAHSLNDDGPTSYLGTLLVQTKRHVRNLGELSRDESLRLGLVLSRVSRALIRATGAEWTYCFSFTEGYRHVHFIVAARYPGLPREYVRLSFAEWPDAPRGPLSEVEGLCRRLRAEIGNERSSDAGG